MRYALLPILCLAAAAPAAGETSALSIDEQGARHGQALAAMAICPGAKTTAKVAELAASIPAAERANFEKASGRIVAAWQKAFLCQDVDPAQAPREMNGCRKSKILTCNMTWQEIGPGGTALPGLLEFAPAAD